MPHCVQLVVGDKGTRGARRDGRGVGMGGKGRGPPRWEGRGGEHRIYTPCDI